MENSKPWGGARKNAGRKRGQKSGVAIPSVKKTRVRRKVPEEAEIAVAALSPLDVMLEAMRRFARGGQWGAAAAVAKMAAPYIHPRPGLQKAPDALAPVERAPSILDQFLN